MSELFKIPMFHGGTVELFKRTDDRLSVRVYDVDGDCVRDAMVEREAKNLRDALIELYPQWTSVDSVPPAIGEQVLLRYHAHYLHEQVIEFDCCTGYYDGKRFVAKDQKLYQKRTVQVTHYMPLPKPPSEVNDG